MHDIKFIRNNPEKFEKQMYRRGLNIDSSSILGIDKVIRKKQSEIQVIQEQRNNSSKEIGKLISEGKDASDLKKNISEFKSTLTKLDHEIKNFSNELKRIKKCSYLANDLGIEVHAGHGLDYKTTKILAGIKEIEEFNIGHFIIGESIFMGFKNVVKKFKTIIK